MARSKLLIILLIGIVVLLLGTVGILLFQASRQNESSISSSKSASVSGTFDVNGVIPAGASITVTQKIVGSQNSKIFASNLPVSDQSPWSFNQAQTGKTYEIQASVVVNGSIIATSAPLEVTAPADEESLTIDIESKTHTSGAVISGNILVAGYIPPGATITVKGRKLGAQSFSTVAQNLDGAAKQFMSYSSALSGVTYEVEGVLLDQNGKTIGTSNVLAVTAPAVNELLTINSSATPPAAPTPTPTSVNSNPNSNQPTPTPQPAQGGTSISGGINFNGAAPSNSRIVIFQQAAGASNNQVAVNNVAPIDGSTWSWPGAQSGTWYSLVAVLKQHNSNGTDTDIATSPTLTVAAPATNVIFTLNSGISIPQPTGNATVSCQTYNGGPNQNNWNVQISFPPVSGAQSYWYQIGNNNGGNNILNSANTSNTVNIVLNNNTTYYARYAYANIPSTPLGSNQWSPFSSSSTMQCSH